ncbi:MAG: response regulator [Clostridiales bacterium]|jgi:putative two-component system response regulator|nr:response regulator [Clostridiales bacterium]
MEQNRKTILIVDDNPSNLTTGKNLLKLFYEVYPVPSAARMFDILTKVTPNLILLDIDMPEMDGYEAIKRLKSSENYADIPVIFLTSQSDEKSEMRGFDLGAADYVFKPFSPPLLIRRIKTQLLIAEQRQTITQNVKELSEIVRINTLNQILHNESARSGALASAAAKKTELNSRQNAIMNIIVTLIGLHDKSCGEQIIRIRAYMKALITGLIRMEQHLSVISDWDMDLMLQSAGLYDVGKLGVPENILNKYTKLLPEEEDILKTHVPAGVDTITKIMNETEEYDLFNYALSIIGFHHERWDGKGYPHGLRGEEIPLEARLMAIADAYNEMITWKQYKKTYTHDEAAKVIEEGSASSFDPALVDVFFYMENEIREITHNYLIE